MLVPFLHKSYCTPEFPDCVNLVGADWMESLRWANTERFMHFRETNTDPSMYFRDANTELLLLVLLPTLFTISLPSLLPILLPVLLPT